MSGSAKEEVLALATELAGLLGVDPAEVWVSGVRTRGESLWHARRAYRCHGVASPLEGLAMTLGGVEVATMCAECSWSGFEVSHRGALVSWVPARRAVDELRALRALEEGEATGEQLALVAHEEVLQEVTHYQEGREALRELLAQRLRTDLAGLYGGLLEGAEDGPRPGVRVLVEVGAWDHEELEGLPDLVLRVRQLQRGFAVLEAGEAEVLVGTGVLVRTLAVREDVSPAVLEALAVLAGDGRPLAEALEVARALE